LGSGGDPERGKALAEEHLGRLKAACTGADLVLVVAGLGGGTGTGIMPVLARAAKETGALALALVMTPFDCEGSRRQRLAQQGLQALRQAADGVICMPNQKVFGLLDQHTSVLDTFKMTNELLAQGVSALWRLVSRPGLIDVHFADICEVLRDRHCQCGFATAESLGPTRSREVVDKLLAHPLLESGQALAEAEAVLVSLMGGPDLAMMEVQRVMEEVNRQCDRAQVIMGAAIDESFRDRLAVTVFAARKMPAPTEAAPASSAPVPPEELGTQLLNRTESARPGSRFVPPPPALPPEQLQQLMFRQKAAGGGRKQPKLRQSQLPLEIVSKGRFDKSEPTIYKGEDLDVPTYIRRGVALN
jgi:cell division protein FtsZ